MTSDSAAPTVLDLDLDLGADGTPTVPKLEASVLPRHKFCSQPHYAQRGASVSLCVGRRRRDQSRG